MDPVKALKQKKIGRKLADLRRAAELSQMGLSENTGIPLSVVVAYETGRRMLGTKHLEALAKAFNLSVGGLWDVLYLPE